MLGICRPRLVVALVILGLLVAVLPSAATSAAPGGAAPSGLTVEQRTSPADVDDLTGPILGWHVPSARQSGYQVQVATSRSRLASGRFFWDSGRVASTSSTNVPYTGPALDGGEGYEWRVRTWSGEGNASPWSLPAHFGTAVGGDWGDSRPIWLGSPAALGWTGYTLEATFSITTQNATIVFNAQDAENYLMWQFRGDGVNQLAPHQRVNGTFTQLKAVPLGTSLQRGTDYRIRIEVSGSTVRTYLDGELVDTTEDVRFTGGSIGFRTGGSERNSWDDLSVTGADGAVLYENDFESPSTDFSCGTVAAGRLSIGTGQNCVYGAGSTDWAFLRGEFATAADKEVAWATVFATGSSAEPGRQYVYKLWLNGRFVGLGPTRSISNETRYDGFDVTDLVHEGGPNALGAIAWTTRDKRFQAQVVVEYTDGSRQTFGTGDAWTSLPGSSVFPSAGSIGTSYFTAPKENLQAVAYPFGFDSPGFDDSEWQPATPKAPYDDLVATPTDKVTQRTELPVEVVEKAPGHYFVDYGRTWLGGVALDLDGAAGQVVELRFGEELSSPQTVRYAMRTGNTYQDRWTLIDGPQHLETWGMRVFRYLEVIGAPTGLTAEDFPALAQVYPFDTDGAVFSSSDTALNQVWKLSRNTVEATNHNLYVDSWTREREPYEADSYLQMMANFFTSSDPTLGNYSIDYLLTRRTWPTEWPMYTILAMHDSYQQTGDVAQLERSYDQLVQKLPTEWVEQDTGLIRKDFRSNGCSSQTDCDIVDWPTSERDGFVFRPYNTVINATRLPQLHGHGRRRGGAREGRRRRELPRHRRSDSRGDEPVPVGRRKGCVSGRPQRGPDPRRALGRARQRLRERVRGAGRRPGIPRRGLHRIARHAVQRVLRGVPDRVPLQRRPLGPGVRPDDQHRRAQLDEHDQRRRRRDRRGLGRVAEVEHDLLPPVGGLAGVQHPAGDVRDTADDARVRHVRRTSPVAVRRLGEHDAADAQGPDRGGVPHHRRPHRCRCLRAGNTVASVHVPAGDATVEVVYVDGRATPAVHERGYLRVDGVASGCHVFSTLPGGDPKDDDRLTSICH